MIMQYTHLGVYGIVKQDNKILLIKKARGPYTNLFDLPGGGIEFGETPEQALIREMAEETGLSVTNYRLSFCDSVCFKHDVTSDGSVEELHHIGIFYDIVVEDGVAIKSESDGLDSNGAFWFDMIDGDFESLTPFAKLVL